LNTANLNALIDTWSHGTKGLVLLYALIGVFSLAGLKRGRASLRQYIAWPVTTLATLVVVVLATQVILWALEKFAGLTFGGNPRLLPVVLYMMGGFVGGLYWAKRGQPLAAIERRGALVFDGDAAQVATRKHRSKVRRLPPAQIPLTVAGVAVPFEGEFKHFK